jgi:methylated-DNA-[protein]-cysteine S-methyltransferase
MAERFWTTLGTPVGRVSVACSDAGVTAVRFGPPPRRTAVTEQTGAARLAAAAARQVAEYFAGTRRAFELPLDRAAASRLQLHVLGVLFDSVSFGQTVTYGALARLAAAGPDGIAVPARAIGQLMGSNPIPIIVPCHRVVAADGLGGYSGGAGIEIKRWLLTFEGALPPTLDWAMAGPARLAGPAGHRDR